jgi:hypothetical protein
MDEVATVVMGTVEQWSFLVLALVLLSELAFQFIWSSTYGPPGGSE